MSHLGLKKKLVSASLVALGATGVTFGGAAAAHADTMIGLYDTQAQCLAVKVVYQSSDPGGSYYFRMSAHRPGRWADGVPGLRLP
ncbi:hypothetical protein AB0L61_22730 [Streptomyces tendae]|uniref:hypothetical protein n=1 Tax=Streptomyces tendae TaxID=1932 RepID=UPI0034169193